jgi:hypothetical protein
VKEDINKRYDLIFSEISKGFSTFKFLNKNVYIKHHSLSSQIDFLSLNSKYKEEAINTGLESEADKLAEAIDGGWWSKDNEASISLLNTTISNLQKTKLKLQFPSQKQSIEEEIKKNERILYTYLIDRNSIIGYTIEKYVDSKINDYIIINSCFKDLDLKCLFFDSEYFDEIDSDSLNKFKEIFSKNYNKFSAYNLKCVSATGFFQNMIYISESPVDIWGKPLISCSQYQSDLLLYGKIYRNFVKSKAELGKPIPDEIILDPEKLISFAEANASSKPFKKNKTSDTRVSSFVGATNEDLKSIGVEVEKVKGKSLLQMAKESGGIIEKSDYLSAREK